MKNDDYKKQYIIVAGSLWTDRVKRCYEDEQQFDWRDHLKLDATVESIFLHIEPELKKDYTMTVAGHSLGAVVGAQLGLFLQQKQMKVARVVAFGLPNMMTEKTAAPFKSLNLVRVVDGLDPVEFLFPGHIHVGKQVTVLSKNYFCFENKFPELGAGPAESTSAPTTPKLSKKDSSDKLGKDASPRRDSKDSSREKDKDKKKDKDGMVASSSSAKLQTTTKRAASTGSDDGSTSGLKKKKGQLDTRPHLIDSYLKRLKPKLKGPTENVDPKDIPTHR
jgi:hypothetical protein